MRCAVRYTVHSEMYSEVVYSEVCTIVQCTVRCTVGCTVHSEMCSEVVYSGVYSMQ